MLLKKKNILKNYVAPAFDTKKDVVANIATIQSN